MENYAEGDANVNRRGVRQYGIKLVILSSGTEATLTTPPEELGTDIQFRRINELDFKIRKESKFPPQKGIKV
ncbi:MAG TPA: hypothetical protein VK957_19650 [Lunatimonas sp.]|nr:hypothetical protein [Lunatimonas sp.]